MAEEKISFLYPTLIREGMQEGVIYPPNILITPENRDQKQKIVITAGFILRPGFDCFFRIRVEHKGSSVVHDPVEKNRIEVVFHQQLIHGARLAVCSMSCEGLDLSKTGLYKATLSVHKAQNDIALDEPITENYCEFYVSHKDDEYE